MKKEIYLILLLFSVSLSIHSQEKFSVCLFTGKSDVRLGSDRNNILGNYYTPHTSFKAGILYNVNRRDSISFYVSGGAQLTSNGLRMNLPDGQTWPETGKPYRNERYYYFDIPVFLNYKFEEWLIFKVGAKGSLLVGTHNLLNGMDTKPFTFGLVGGGCLKIQNFTINAEYSFDLTESLRFSEWSWKYSIFHMGIGYYFTPSKIFKKVKS